MDIAEDYDVKQIGHMYLYFREKADGEGENYVIPNLFVHTEG